MKLRFEMVLDRSNISKGSLYHHFEDIYHLLEAAMISRFARYVDTNIASLRSLLETATTSETLYAGLAQNFCSDARRGYAACTSRTSTHNW
jgi:AcrR family transcriptional regulator